MFKSWSLSEIGQLDFFVGRKMILGRSEPIIFLRVLWQDGEIGYSCLQPWPHLGDPHQQQILQIFKALQEDPEVLPFLDPLTTKAFFYARNMNLLLKQLQKEKSWIESLEHNRLVTRPQTLTSEQIKAYQKQGYKTLKVKLNLHTLLDLLLKKEMLKPFKLRFDFNSGLDASQWQMVQNHLMTLERLSYVEEPMPYDKIIYARSLVPVALDHEFKKSILSEKPEFSHLILKPLKQDLELHLKYADLHSLDVTYTNSMDLQWTQCLSLAEMSFYKNHRSLQNATLGFQTPPCLIDIDGRIDYEIAFFEPEESVHLQLQGLAEKIQQQLSWLENLPWGSQLLVETDVNV